MRKEFIETTQQIILENKKTALLLGDISVFGFRELLVKERTRTLNLGILEQSIVGIGAGFAMKGFTPFIHTIAPFLVERAFEQIKVDFGYQNLSGNFISVGASFDYSTLGCTHHCPGDVHLMNQIPNTNIFLPGHSKELQSMLKNEWKNGEINYFRLTEQSNSEPYKTTNGSSLQIKKGRKALVIAVGPMLQTVLDAIGEDDFEIHYVNLLRTNHSLTIPDIAAHKSLIIVEPFYSGLILNNIKSSLSLGLKIFQIGVKKDFIGKYGTSSQILEYLSLDSKSLREQIRIFTKLKN